MNYLVAWPADAAGSTAMVDEAEAYRLFCNAHVSALVGQTLSLYGAVEFDIHGQPFVGYYGPPFELYPGEPFPEPAECAAKRPHGVITPSVIRPSDLDPEQ